MSNSLQILCIKDTEGYRTEGEMYPARQFWRAFSYLVQEHEIHDTKRADVTGIRVRYG